MLRAHLGGVSCSLFQPHSSRNITQTGDDNCGNRSQAPVFGHSDARSIGGVQMSDYVDIQINKVGPSGRPVAVVLAPEGATFDRLSSLIQKEITRNDDLRKKLG